METVDIIIRPLITEKSTHQKESLNTYAFQVHPQANKQQIRTAVEKLYNVKVTDVRTMSRKGKPRRTRHKVSSTSDWKRAVVVLDQNSRIDLF